MAEIIFETVKKPLEERIIDAGCIYWNVPRDYFFQKSGSYTEMKYRRSIVMYILKNNTQLSGELIAKKFGLSDHRNIARVIENIEFQKDSLPQVYTDITQIILLADKLGAKFLTVAMSLDNLKP
jgi:chromosomal replication initiation ATPase DnaA